MLYQLADHYIGLDDAAIYALVSIVLVFVVLIMIIGITTLIFKLVNLKSELTVSKDKEVVPS